MINGVAHNITWTSYNDASDPEYMLLVYNCVCVYAYVWWQSYCYSGRVHDRKQQARCIHHRYVS